MTAEDQSKKKARKRLSVLQLADTLGNVSEACRRSGMDRASFYIWKMRYEEYGFEGLVDKSTPRELENRVLKLSFRHPDWGCSKISEYMKYYRGESISSPTVQKIFNKHNLKSVYDRTLYLEKMHLEKGRKLNAEQIKLIERINPVFRERNEESTRRGERLCQAVRSIGTLTGIGRIYAHFVVDTFNSYGFARLYSTKLPEDAITLLENEVFPKYKGRKFHIKAVHTNTGSTFSSDEDHPYQDFLWLNDVEHWKDSVRGSKTNGFAERFGRTLRVEFVSDALHKKIYASIDDLQKELDEWLHYYNYERPHRGYRNMGKTPAEC